MMTEFHTEERGFGASAVFRVVSAMATTTLARFLQWGYIEPVKAVEFRTSRFESIYDSA
jgi:hypothetical protein